MKAQNIYAYKALREEGYDKAQIVEQVKSTFEIDTFAAHYSDDGSVTINARGYACPFGYVDFEASVRLETTLDQLGVSQHVEDPAKDFSQRANVFAQDDLNCVAPQALLQNIKEAIFAL